MPADRPRQLKKKKPPKKPEEEEERKLKSAQSERAMPMGKKKICQKWDSNPRLENQTAT